MSAKTNAVRFCEIRGVPVELAEYNTAGGFVGGEQAAAAIGKDPAAVFKTLVTRGQSGQVYVFLIPVAAQLDRKKAAQAVREKALTMLPLRELTAVTGYVQGGCSPLAMKKAYPTVFASQLLDLSAVTFNGGTVGLQMTIATKDLARLLAYEVADLTKPEQQQD